MQNQDMDEDPGLEWFEVKPDGDLIPGFVPNREELRQMLKYWCKKIIHIGILEIDGAMTRHGHSRRVLAFRRIREIVHVLGKKRADAVIRKVEEEFRKDLAPEIWRAFREGRGSSYYRCS